MILNYILNFFSLKTTNQQGPTTEPQRLIQSRIQFILALITNSKKRFFLRIELQKKKKMWQLSVIKDIAVKDLSL